MTAGERKQVINELSVVHFIHCGPKGEPFNKMDYHSLVRLLAVQRAAVS